MKDLRTSVAADLGSAADELRALAAEPVPHLPAGTLVAGHFEVEALLGHGGMGAVYRARDRKLGRRVALKLGLRGVDVARIQREASVLARLAHPNVVTIHEIGEHEGAPVVAMELCGGGTLRQWLAGPRPWRTIVERFGAVGDGLAAAHAAGIVHGDIKPDNILLGDDGRPRLADFGLARAGGTAEAGGERTGAGTPRYMAPELAHGHPTASSDQWAFAVALFEALAGADPFPREATARRAAIERGPSASLPAVPRRIAAAIARALRADPAARWPDVATFVAQLQPPRRRWPVPVIAAGALATAAVLAAAPWQSPAADADLTSVQPARCDGLPIDLDGEWTAARRAEVEAAHPQGLGAVRLAIDQLDHHTREWTAARHRLCKVLPTEPSWSLAIGEAGRACLLASRAELRRLREHRGLAPGELVGHVVALSPPSACADVARLEPVARAPSVTSILGEHDAIAALRDQGRGGEAVARAEALVAALPADAPPLVVGMTNALLGEIQLAQVGLAAAADSTRTAFFAYRVAGSPQAFEPALHLADAYSQAGELALADEWLAHARVEAERVDVAPGNRAVLELMTARLRSLRGDPAGAVHAAEAALRELDGSSDPRRVVTAHSIRGSLSIFLAEDGQLAASVAMARAVVADREQLYGASHPILINDLFNIGLGELDLGQEAAALATLTRAREIADAGLPPQAVLRGYALWNEALALGRRDRHAAREVFDRALALIVAAQGEESSDAVQLRADRAKWSAPG